MTVRAPLGRRTPAVVGMAVGAAITVGGSLAPWVRTGGARRHSYDLFALVGRLGFAPDGPAALALRWWPIVPLIAVSAVVVAWWGWPRAGGIVGVVTAVYAGGVAVAVSAAPAASDVIAVELGAPVTAVGATVLAVASASSLVVGVLGDATDPPRS